MRPYYHSALHLLLINLANDGTRNYVLSWINVKRSLCYKLKIFIHISLQPVGVDL